MNSDQLAERLHEIAHRHECVNHVGVEYSSHTGLNFVLRGRSIPDSARQLENEDNVFVSFVSADYGQVEMSIRTRDTPENLDE